MEGPARPSINHHLHEEVEEPQRQNANHLRLCLPRDVQSSMMPHTGMIPTTDRYIFVVDITNHGQARTDTENRRTWIHGIYILSFV